VRSLDRPQAKARESFIRETAKHEMQVLRDDGEYRHLRFQAAGSVFYYFDLVTWPGHLVICGDAGDYHFSRTRDMFSFFAAERGGGFEDVEYGINPHYWGQKLQGPKPGRDGAMSYSHDALRAHVIGWFEDATGPIDPEAYAAEDYFTSLDLSTWQRFELSRALEREILTDEDDYAAAAHERLRDFEWFYDGSDSWDYHSPGTPSVQISDSWEWDLREFDGRFLWCCWAIVWGIEQYRAATPVAA
jgi:hypothetical protein